HARVPPQVPQGAGAAHQDARQERHAPARAGDDLMKQLEFGFFALVALLVIVGGIATVAAKNPIRGAMGLLTTIVGIAGMYLLLSAEFLAAIEIIVYAGAVVVLFLFVIMLLGPSATSGRDTRGWSARYLGAAVLLISSALSIYLLSRVSGGQTSAFPPAPKML